MTTDIFLSYCWKADTLGRNTHNRVTKLCEFIRYRGLTVWFDKDSLRYGNIYSGMSRGIDGADIVIVCITRTYVEKVYNALMSIQAVDNCACEWSYAIHRRKPIIPVIMEPGMLDSTTWPPGPVGMHIASNIYVDASGDNWDGISKQIEMLVRCMPKDTSRIVRIDKHRRPPSLPPIRNAVTSDRSHTGLRHCRKWKRFKHTFKLSRELHS